MPGLLTLRTDLKSLKYGQDRFDGGSSGQPYIVTSIEDGTVSANVGSNNILKIFKIDNLPGVPNINSIISRSKLGTAGRIILTDDSYIRGGIVGATQASINDAFRIGLFLTSLPKGSLFIAKQVGLQLSNPKLESRQLEENSPGKKFLNLINRAINVIGPTRTYNLGLNTFAQTAVNAFGIHFHRHGIDPVRPFNYENIVEFNNEHNSNRLVEYTNKLNLGYSSLDSYYDFIPESEIDKRTRGEIRKESREIKNQAKANLALDQSRFGFDKNYPRERKRFNKRTEKDILKAQQRQETKAFREKNILTTYLGGPESVYGIGLTTIRRYSNTENIQKISDALEQSGFAAGKTRTDKGSFESVKYNEASDYGSITNQLLDAEVTDEFGKTFTKENLEILDLDLATFSSMAYPSINPYKIIAGRVENILGLGDVDNVNNVPITSLLKSNATYANLKKILDTKQLRSFQSVLYNNDNTVNTTFNAFGIYSSGSDYNFSANPNSTESPAYESSYGKKTIIIKLPWNEVYRENRIGSFGPTKQYPSGKHDSINLTPLFDDNKNFDNAKINLYGYDHNIKDLAKFVIQSVNTDKPSESTFMIFRAYLTQLTDSVNATWTDIKYAGRGNPFYIYGGFNRKIQIGFKVAALSEEEMAPMYSKLNFLMSSLMPDYGGGNVMRGPLHRMTIGNYLDSQLGILESLTYTIPNDSPWEIALDTLDGKKMLVLPHILEVQMSFIPIGAETGWGDVTSPNSGSLNKIEKKSTNISFIAQNTSGINVNKNQYYDGWLKTNVYENKKANSTP